MCSLANLWGFTSNLFHFRSVSYSSSLLSNHYVVLGITPTATQNEIKAAYFELCKKYHPDKNKGSEETVIKFRKISEAYEVLGNSKLKKAYDQKMGFCNYNMYSHMNSQRVRDHQPEYNNIQHEHRNARKVYTGRTPIYNFDEWLNSHYPNHNKNNEKYREWKQKRTMGEHSGGQTPFLKQGRFVAFLISFVFCFSCLLLGNDFSETLHQPYEESSAYINKSGETNSRKT